MVARIYVQKRLNEKKYSFLESRIRRHDNNRQLNEKSALLTFFECFFIISKI